MSIERWDQWLDKSRKIKDKYEHNKDMIFRELLRHRKRFIGDYKKDEVLVLLFLMRETISMQEASYQKFIEGCDFLLTLIHDPEYRDKFQEVKHQSKRFIENIDEEKDTLKYLKEEFKHINKKINLKEIEGGLFFRKIKESRLRNISEQIIGIIPKVEEEHIKQTHQIIIHEIIEERTELEKIKEQAKQDFYRILNQMSNPVFVKKAAAVVYFGTYLAFFLNAIDEDTRNHTTTVARHFMR